MVSPSLPQYTNWETWVRLMMFWETQCSQMSLAEFMALKLSRLITSLLTWFLNMVPSTHHQRQTERPHGWDSWCFEGLVFSDTFPVCSLLLLLLLLLQLLLFYICVELEWVLMSAAAPLSSRVGVKFWVFCFFWVPLRVCFVEGNL